MLTHALVGAVAPIAPVALSGLFIPLALLAVFIVALGITSAGRAFVEAIFGLVRLIVKRIPLVGGAAASAVGRGEQYVSNRLGTVEAYLDRKVGHYFHELAKLVAWVGDELRSHAHLLWVLSTVLLGSEITALIQRATQALQREIHALRGQQHATTRIVTRTLPGRVTAADRTLQREVTAVAGELEHVREWDIPRLRGRVGALERESAQLWKKVRGKWLAVGVAGAAALVAAALARLHLGWLRCKNVRDVGRRVCGLDAGLLEALLLDSLAIFSLFSVRTFARELREVEDEAIKIMEKLVQEWPK